MTDQQARDFYTKDSVLAFGSIMFVMWGNKHAVIVRDTEGRDQFLSKDVVRHYPDGAPLGKFGGLDPYKVQDDFTATIKGETSRTWKLGIRTGVRLVNAILGVEG